MKATYQVELRPWLNFPGLRAVLIEPLLVVGVSAFWIMTNPIAGVAVFLVKAWDRLVVFAQPPSGAA